MTKLPRVSAAGAAAAAVVALLLAGAGHSKIGTAGTLVIDGEKVDVRWTDGDTLAIDSGPLAKKHARLADYNTLEAYGPVHRWGTWKAAELYEIAKSAGAVAAATTWTCTTGGPDGEDGGYGRILLSCPDAAKAMVGAGLAHVFAIGHPADPALLAIQADAQKRGAGIWAKGVPAVIITSVHSAAEGRGHPYNRVCDTHTGAAGESPHDKSYATCEEVCAGPAGADSCMVYVPFDHRYRDRPDCLLR